MNMNFFKGSSEQPSNVPPPATAAPIHVNTAETSVRLAFLRKVYTLLTINFFITIGISCLFMFVKPIRNYVVSHSWVLWASLIVAFATLIALACIKVKYPLNLALMYLFVVAFSVMIGVIVASFEATGEGEIVLQAFCATGAVFLAITSYVFVTKKDFSFLYGFLSAALLVLIALSIINFALNWATPDGRYTRVTRFAISVFGSAHDWILALRHLHGYDSLWSRRLV